MLPKRVVNWISTLQQWLISFVAIRWPWTRWSAALCSSDWREVLMLPVWCIAEKVIAKIYRRLAMLKKIQSRSRVWSFGITDLYRPVFVWKNRPWTDLPRFLRRFFIQIPSCTEQNRLLPTIVPKLHTLGQDAVREQRNLFKINYSSSFWLLLFFILAVQWKCVKIHPEDPQ